MIVRPLNYGQRGIQYVHIDCGNAAQNICLQETSLGFGTVQAGAFKDERVANVLQLEQDHMSLYILPAGESKKAG